MSIVRTIGLCILTAVLLAGPVVMADGTTGEGEGAEEGVVGHLETREYLITIKASEDGSPLYTVKKRDGTLVALELNEDDLLAKLPALKKTLRGALANDASLRKTD